MDADSGHRPLGTRVTPASEWKEGTDIVTFGPFRLDGRRRVLTADGREVALQPRAFDLLMLLVGCRGQVLSADEIIGHVWRGIAVGDNNLGVQLSTLRRVLAEHGGRGLIVTVPGRGYRFVGDVAAAVSPAAASAGLPPAPTNVQAPPRRAAPTGIALAGAAVLALTLCLATLVWRSTLPVAVSSANGLLPAFSPPPHSIAVLAFANLSNDPGQDYLSDGLSEALIDLLSRVSQLQVTARTSSFSFKGRAATIGEIARKLDVGAVLEGSLRRQGTHLRIDAHLSDARTGYQLWSQSYDRRLDDMLKLQDEIAGAVSQALQIKLLDTDAAGFSLGGTTNPQAFDAYLQGEQHLRALGGENDKALLDFRKAIGLDPNFALAQSSLALVLVEMNNESEVYDDAFRERMKVAQRAAERAVELAPKLGLLHARLAMVLRFVGTDMNAAWMEANRARALTPGDATVEQEYGTIASLVDHDNEAVAAATQAVNLDPLRPDSWYELGEVLDCTRKFDAARAAVERSILLLGHSTIQAQAEIGSLLVEQGKAEEARRYCAAMPDWGGGCLLLANHLLGRRADVNAKLEKMQFEMKDTAAYNYAEIYAQLNQPTLAMRWLTRAGELHDPALPLMKCDVNLDPIRNKSGFKEIEKGLNFPPAGH